MHLFLYWVFVQLSLFLTGVDGYNSHFVKTEHGQVHYLEAEGQGDLPPMVFFHGIGCQATDMYPVMMHARQYARKVISVDLPAHGQTDIPVEKLSLAEIRKTFNQGMDQILAQEEPVVLFGNSLGGWQALLYAEHRPEELAGLIVVSPAGARAEAPQYDRLRQIFAHDSTEKPESLLPLLFNKQLANPGLVADLIKARFSDPRVQVLMQKLTPESTLQPQTLQKLSMPTLLIWGQKDRIFPGMLPFFKQNLPPQAQVLEPAEFTHSPYIEGKMDQELSELMFSWATGVFPQKTAVYRGVTPGWDSVLLDKF
ncbi:hypothetical protein COW36_00185 [bacterium (Candidatus Blackallbacteria) CG17_big_fil_post_rev_8_21_14_2_50_48_46]|uniref:AB hydrolase-1 domain-containing protein n=1 Tax=bacterium (Candidatus Blackallbacteria) CG17_big_fil_post_rev_8_21_14_2_50_48_46 TaxID=2014261 RepID=A0A2M7GBN8_9BACT|nr:MAG: hypothetical protein COW64_25690 [bacterium (Candidatus Blackallbacteria) CG18_big_fil_WC_8_21_14_2_50_49_26]PIW19599.1 MAG: hypothetical protein COW36_00185 [bacterium (Candidatus Blackallbacteria) CG17_big_fil_post_rev_8_21_14_2_50_48_46]PIW47669.1 MAG: hypothetical protein COW20_11855 [bacterium (Candidatus Blackallbacteria) CG13_big_fil_rev_8_21_14_2_50_49_14]